MRFNYSDLFASDVSLEAADTLEKMEKLRKTKKCLLGAPLVHLMQNQSAEDSVLYLFDFGCKYIYIQNRK